MPERRRDMRFGSAEGSSCMECIASSERSEPRPRVQLSLRLTERASEAGPSAQRAKRGLMNFYIHHFLTEAILRLLLLRSLQKFSIAKFFKDLSPSTRGLRPPRSGVLQNAYRRSEAAPKRVT